MLNFLEALCHTRLHVAMGQCEAFRIGALTAPASLKEGHKASKLPLSSPRLPVEGQRPPQQGQSSDNGIGMEATQGAPTANLLLFQSHPADQASSSPSRIDGDPSHPAQSYRQGLSPLLTLPLLSPGLVYQVSKATRRTIGTWVTGTPVHFLLAVRSSEVGGAFTGIAGPLVALLAGAPIEARGVGTAQGAVFAV